MVGMQRTPGGDTRGAEGESLPWAEAIVGRHGSLRPVVRAVARVAPTRAPVLLLGESGTGKEVIARALHAASARAGRRFLSENCAALAETVVESELFGHVRGAFTGAEGGRPGLFQLADRGTLFLDEIGDMPLRIQGKLLRVLQEGEVRPVGGREVVRVDVRILSATNRDLRDLMERGTFREDLFYRLNVFTVRLPPLRQRREDIPALVDRFFEELGGREHAGRSFRMGEDAMALLLRYNWPGNIRELRNVVERAMVVCEGDVIRVPDLPGRIVDFALAEPDDAYAAGARCAEQRMIEAALLRAGGNKAAASAEIGWNRPKLYRRMRALGIHRGFGRRPPDPSR